MTTDPPEPRPIERKVSEPVVLGKMPSHAEQIRTLLEGVQYGGLCTQSVAVPGYPYGSIVEFALDTCNLPIFLLSDMAEHTVNFKADPRASLLVTEPFGSDDPVALARATLMGKIEAVPEAELEAIKPGFLKRHAAARSYAEFGDFHFWRMQVVRVRYIGGFGRMSWVPAEEYQEATPDPLHSICRSLVQSLNEERSADLLELVRRGADVTDATGVRMTEMDRYGFDCTVVSKSGLRRVRMGFFDVVKSAEDVRFGFTRLLEAVRKPRES